MTLVHSVTIEGLRTKSEANQREHWHARHRRTKPQRLAARLHVQQLIGSAPNWKPARVHLTRLAPRTLDDDNLAGALKAVRDGVADAFGCDDSARSGIEWTRGQEKHALPKHYAVRIEVWE